MSDRGRTDGPAGTVGLATARHAARSARRRLAGTPVGSVWRWGRKRLGGAPSPRRGAAGTQEETRADLPREPYPLDLSVFDLDPDPDRATAVLDGAFGHGYLVTTGRPVLPGFLEQWATTVVGPLCVRTAPRTKVTVGEHQGATVVMLGHPVDVDRATTDARAVAQALALRLHAGNGDSAAAVREAAYLAGRWTILLLTRTSEDTPERNLLTVVPDTMGTQPVFYAVGPDGLALGSADTLVAVARDLPVDPESLRLDREIHDLKPAGVVFLPGRLTHYVGVEQVVPNCLLTVALDRPTDLRHERFWPFEERVEDDDLEAVHEEFADRLRRQLVLVDALGPTAWSLTGGLDCRVLLAHLKLPPRPGTFSFTYFNPRDGVNDPDAARDVFVASEIAFRIGLPHRVLRWRQAKQTSVFGRLHTAIYPVTTTSHGAAHAMWADLPHDLVEIQGNGGEIGTVFRKNRPPGPLTPGKAANMWLGRAFEDHPTYLQIFEDYLAYAHLDDELLRGYDHHDVLYWEHRMGRWGWKKFLDSDLSHRVLPPFNDRRLLELMLSLPEEQRVGKALYARVLREHPELRVDDVSASG